MIAHLIQHIKDCHYECLHPFYPYNEVGDYVHLYFHNLRILIDRDKIIGYDDHNIGIEQNIYLGGFAKYVFISKTRALKIFNENIDILVRQMI